MAPHHQAAQIAERQAIEQLARRIEGQISKETPRRHIYAAALGLVITYAEFDGENELLATLLRAAADEMTKNSARFGQTAH